MNVEHRSALRWASGGPRCSRVWPVRIALIRALLCAAAMWSSCEFGLAAEADQPLDNAFNVSQKVIGTKLPDFTFLKADNTTVHLSQFRGKPLLVSLIYTSCADICPTTIENLVPAAAVAETLLGQGSFNIVTIGFDTRHDTPARMQGFARAHGAGTSNWFFLSSDGATMDRLSTALGFSYLPLAGGFNHLSQITVVDENGQVYDQIYGSRLDTPTIVDPLKKLVLGGQRSVFSLRGLGDRVKLWCTAYDRRTGGYYFNYAIFLSLIIGAICLGGVSFFLVKEARKSLRTTGS